MDNIALKTMVRSIYDIQKSRIRLGLRIIAAVKQRYGDTKANIHKPEDCKEEETKLLDEILVAYKAIIGDKDKIPTPKKFKSNLLIGNYGELCSIEMYVSQLAREERGFRQLEYVLQDYPIYTEYLKGIDGVGPAIAATLISEFDIFKAKYPSSFIMYSGLSVAKDGRGMSMRKEHLIDVEYIDKHGEIQVKKSAQYKPMLKSKLMGILATSFIRVGNEKYKGIYNDYKHRLENHVKYKDVSKAHRHMMACRYMIKMFLIDFHIKWREMEGLEVSRPYHEAKLGYKHGIAS